MRLLVAALLLVGVAGELTFQVTILPSPCLLGFVCQRLCLSDDPFKTLTTLLTPISPIATHYPPPRWSPSKRSVSITRCSPMSNSTWSSRYF
jgi:hypothetical protein